MHIYKTSIRAHIYSQQVVEIEYYNSSKNIIIIIIQCKKLKNRLKNGRENDKLKSLFLA